MFLGVMRPALAVLYQGLPDTVPVPEFPGGGGETYQGIVHSAVPFHFVAFLTCCDALAIRQRSTL
jgi:hypothetical protein